jgi:zinc protease
VESDKISPYTETALATSLISKELKGSKIIKTKKLMPFGAEEWTLANNAKVVFKKVDFQKDQVTISGTSPGGLSLYKPEILPSAMLMSTFVDQFGVGDFNAVSLKKMLAGKKASMKPSLGDLSEVLFGSATPKDYDATFIPLF